MSTEISASAPSQHSAEMIRCCDEYLALAFEPRARMDGSLRIEARRRTVQRRRTRRSFLATALARGGCPEEAARAVLLEYTARCATVFQ